jgi:hypothetical protein
VSEQGELNLKNAFQLELPLLPKRLFEDPPIDFEMDVSYRNRMRKAVSNAPQLDFTVKVSFVMKTTGYEQAERRLGMLIGTDAAASDLLARRLRIAVIRSVVANIRVRFLMAMERALEMHVIQEGNKDRTNSPKKRMEDIRLKKQISNNLARLNEAQMASNYRDADKIRDRLTKQFNMLYDRLSRTPDGETTESHWLSKLAGNQFRKRMFDVLQVLTHAEFAGFERTGNSVVVGIGNAASLEQIKTPSATKALSNRESSSRHKTFWRHLEFGTGVLRNAAKDRRNTTTSPAAEWSYGPRGGPKSLLLKGTLPMNFLYSNTGDMYPQDYTRLFEEVSKELDALLTTG